MGLILDTSIFVAIERQRFDLPEFLKTNRHREPFLATAITIAELYEGVERSMNSRQRQKRQKLLELTIDTYGALPFDLAVAPIQGRLAKQLRKAGTPIGDMDSLIAATALQRHHAIATLNTKDFVRVPGLEVLDATDFLTEA